MSNDAERRISDADVEAIVEELRKQVSRQFYDDLGRGIWSALKTLAIAAALALAAWGYKTGSGGH
jgi:citrate lyase gamma subunit